MSETILGQKPTAPGVRDAIHVAVASVVCGDRSLTPGQRVGINDKGEATSRIGERIGIVDPYLDYPVKKGELFYLCLFPQTVTGMKHHWSHPSFPEAPDPKAFHQMEERFNRKKFEPLAERHGMTYEGLMSVAEEYLITGDEHCLNFDTPDVSSSEWEEFWKHFHAVAGKEFNPKEPWRLSPFRCAC